MLVSGFHWHAHVWLVCEQRHARFMAICVFEEIAKAILHAVCEKCAIQIIITDCHFTFINRIFFRWSLWGGFFKRRDFFLKFSLSLSLSLSWYKAMEKFTFGGNFVNKFKCFTSFMWARKSLRIRYPPSSEKRKVVFGLQSVFDWLKWGNCTELFWFYLVNGIQNNWFLVNLNNLREWGEKLGIGPIWRELWAFKLYVDIFLNWLPLKKRG